MAENTIDIDAPPERVFEVLSDPKAYGHWVVGSRYIRGADPGFPGKGTAFDHAVGVGPLTIKDHTRVLESDPPRRLVLEAMARPLGTALVDIRIDAREGGGSTVTIIEDPKRPGVVRSLLWPVAQLGIRGRNVESLRRLKAMAEDPAVQAEERG